MDRDSDGRRAAEVWVDHSTLRGEVSGSDTLYKVSLKGRVEARFLEAFRAALGESVEHRCFRLEPSNATVVFSCHTVDGPGQVFDQLEGLETLLALVNRRVEVRGSGLEAVASGVRPRGFA